MTSGIRIPEPGRQAIHAIAEVDGATFEQLVRVLQGITLPITPDQLVQAVVTSATGLPESEREGIGRIVVSLAALRESRDVPPDDVANEVVRARSSGVPDEKRELFVERLTALLNNESVKLAAKVLDVLTEFERSLHDARIITDLRPIFTGKLEDLPSAVAVTHTLRVRYHQNDELQEFFVTLNSSNLASLREILDRAELKANTLTKLPERTGFPYLESDLE